MTKIKCDYCGKEKKEIGFYIGASLTPDWTMIEGTGKMTCPDCWNTAREDGRKAINKHVQWVREGMK